MGNELRGAITGEIQANNRGLRDKIGDRNSNKKSPSPGNFYFGLDFFIELWQDTTSYFFNVGNLIQGGTLKMGNGASIAIADRTEKEKLMRFTCLVDDELTHVQAKDPTDADKKNGEESILIIQGRAEDIGARRMKEVSGQYMHKPGLKKGVRCTIEVGDPVRIANAEYCGEEKLGEYDFLAFVKKGTRFWVFPDEIRFNSIGRKRL